MELTPPPTQDEEEVDYQAPTTALYVPKLHYSVADIRAIVRSFPKNKKWTSTDLNNPSIFPPDLQVRIQLINHRLYIMARPTPAHQELLGNLLSPIVLFVRKSKLGKVYVAPLGVHIDESTCVEPDIVVVLSNKATAMTEEGLYEAPDLVVEVISKANYKKLREAKKEQYAAFGVTEYWEIYPRKKQINVETLTKDTEGKANYQLFSSAKKQGIIHSQVLQGFTMAVEDVFNS